MKEQKLLKQFIPKNINLNLNITCFDITDDYEEIICGYEDGTIVVINAISKEVKYRNNKLHKNCSCIELKLYKKENRELHFISSGGDNQIFYNILTMPSLFFWKLNSQKLNINNTTPIFMIKFIAFPLKIKKQYTNLEFLRKYVIFGSLEFISFYCVESFKEIFTIKKPDFIKECVLPDAQVGIGKNCIGLENPFIKMVVDEKNHLLLIISWEKIIYVYQLPIVGGKSIENYKEIGYYNNLFNIHRIGFMNNSIIYCLDKSFSIKIIDSTKINKGKIEIINGNPRIPKNNYLAEIGKSRLISFYTSSQKKLLDKKNNTKESYLYSIVENNDSIFSLDKNEIYKVELVEWEIFLNNLSKNEDFINLFSIGIDLYKDKMNALSNIPVNKEKTEIRDYLKKCICQYIILNIEEKKIKGSSLEEAKYKKRKRIDDCIKISIELCIEINAVDYLFETIEPILESKDYEELFLEKLEPFILCDKIKDFVLPSNIILKLIF